MTKYSIQWAMLLGAASLMHSHFASASEDEAAKWFVVRQAEVGTCSVAVLIRIAGLYQSGYGRIAGGPYDAESDARNRMTELERAAICLESSQQSAPAKATP